MDSAMADLANYMTRRFEVGEGTSCGYSVTGEQYVSFSIGGVKEEGAPHRVATTDLEKAVELFKNEFDKFSADKRGTLYWRFGPELRFGRELKEGANTHYQISARFLISDKPRLSDAELERKGIDKCIKKTAQPQPASQGYEATRRSAPPTPIRPLFQHAGEAPHERAWCIDGVLHAYELEIIGGNYVLVLKVCA